MMAEQTKFDLLRRMDAAARASIRGSSPSGSSTWTRRATSCAAPRTGTYMLDRQYLVSIVCTPTGRQGSERRSAFASLGGRVDEGYFQKRDPRRRWRAMPPSRRSRLLGAGPAPAGSMPVVIGPGWGGVLIHESFGHASEGDGISRNTSFLSGKLGTKVGSPLLRVVDDARWPNGRGSFAVDDEATQGQKTVLIDGGVLQSYLLDRQSGALLSMRSTGNGRRMSYRNRPIPRMTNTYIDAGTSDPASLLSGITKGFYAAEMGGGSVDTTSGNFNFAVRLGYLIENGKLTQPVRGAVLIGNSLQTMTRIEGIGRDLAVEQTPRHVRQGWAVGARRRGAADRPVLLHHRGRDGDLDMERPKIKDEIERVRILAERSGAAEAETYFEFITLAEVRVRDREVELIQQSAITGIGLRVLRDRRMGFLYTTDLRRTVVDELVNRTIALAGRGDAAGREQAPGPDLPAAEQSRDLRRRDRRDEARGVDSAGPRPRGERDRAGQAHRDHPGHPGGIRLGEVHFYQHVHPVSVLPVRRNCWLSCTAIATEGTHEARGGVLGPEAGLPGPRHA